MRVAAVLTLLVLAAKPSAAQERAFCFHAKPKPACSVFPLTNAGAAFVIGVPTNSSRSPLRGVVDWGFMVNLNTRNAIGVSALASLDEAGFGLGPTVRYRRWMAAGRSFDIGVGVAVVTTEAEGDLQPGSIFGLVRWNPVTWFALTARPDFLQRRVLVGGCCFDTAAKGRMSFGLELGEVPGMVTTGVAGLAALALYLLIASDNS